MEEASIERRAKIRVVLVFVRAGVWREVGVVTREEFVSDDTLDVISDVTVDTEDIAERNIVAGGTKRRKK